MLSVLIPFYNWDVSELLKDLLLSMDRVDTAVEVIVCDDCSSNRESYDQLSRQYDDSSTIKIIRNNENYGRSKTRNILVGMASFEYIVFIDGDSRLFDPVHYLSNYLSAIVQSSVVVGGTMYDEGAPQNKSLHLHWNYGRSRESKKASIRSQAPLRYFFSNNFACLRSVLAVCPFDENLVGYGYEDTLWAKEIGAKGHKIDHIDNSVIHKGLKTNKKFLSDANEAVLTLVDWYQKGQSTHVKLLMTYSNLDKTVIGKFILYLAGILRPVCERLLLSGFANPRVFDLYRLGSIEENLRK